MFQFTGDFRWIYRSILLAMIALCIPACGGGGGGGLPPYTPIAPTILLSDNWSSGPSANWTIVTASATVDNAVGNPAPSMLVNAGGGPTAQVKTALSFSTTFVGLTISIDVSPGVSNGLICIINVATPAPISTYASIVNNQVLFAIGGVSGTIPFTNDGLFHRFTFKSSATGSTATWSRDGVVHLSGAYTVSNIYVLLQDTSSGTHFDNALITRP